MGMKDFYSLVNLANFTVGAAAQSRQYELSLLLNKLMGANAGIRALEFQFHGTIATDAGEIAPWVDVLNAKLTQIYLDKAGETIWDIGSRNAVILNAVQLGIPTNFLGDAFTATATRTIRKTIRMPFLDDAYWKAKDDGLVPAKALRDATLQLQFALDGAYPFTGVYCRIFAEVKGLVGEARPHYEIEKISDKHTKDSDDLRLPAGRQYHRLYVVEPASRETCGANRFDDTVWNISADNEFVKNIRGDELRSAHDFTNPYVDDASTFFLAGTDDLLDQQDNMFQPLLWPRRDGYQGDYQSCAYNAIQRPLVINYTLGANSPAAPHQLLVTWVDVDSDQAMDRKARETGFAGQLGTPRTISKNAADGLGARIFPSKLKKGNGA